MIDTEQLIEKLREMYEKETKLQEGIEQMIAELQQTKDDIELMETAIMYQSNRINREGKWK